MMIEKINRDKILVVVFPQIAQNVINKTKYSITNTVVSMYNRRHDTLAKRLLVYKTHGMGL